MSFFRKIFLNSEEGIETKAYEVGYKDGVKAGLRIGQKEGEKRGWKEAMSTIGKLADEMIVRDRVNKRK
tara:strand:- start:207 stop:413 length:207 start_codon:yes stop_codon:yes gene_type:complete